MTSAANNHEALREALLNLDRLREHEKTARLQMEALVNGLQVLNECQSVSDMYREILSCLRGLIDFDAATILVEENNGFLSSAVSTDIRLRFKSVPIAGCFDRCLKGRATVLTKVSLVSDWPDSAIPDHAPRGDENSSDSATPLESALLVSLPSLANRMILICASSVPAKFNKRDLGLLKSFAPLATQAVRRAIEMEKLNYLATTLDHQAHFDQLTGLPNRTFFENQLENLGNDGDPYSIMFLDLDNFKTVNDTFGHSAGDILLSEVAFRMSTVIGNQDTVARMGGDEFALIIRSINTYRGMQQLCNALLDCIRQPLYLSNSRITPTASIGVLHPAEIELPSQQKMQKADIAMYTAKELGRNQYCFFDDQMKEQVQTEFVIESLLPSAIKQNEFHLVYQPIFNSQTMICDRAEVLIRWGEGKDTRYGPHLFIPIAEKTGHIVELGQWILQQSLTEFSQWLALSNQNTLSINVSQIQLQRSDFASNFIQLVALANIDCRQIELELSENIVAECIDDVLSENLRILQRFGIRFAFDDFGTGSSSLLHLQKFPGTCLKIDKSFIDDIVDSEDQKRLVAGMIDFSHHMQMHVVAEGVETNEQLDILTELGADYIQGYLLAKPARAESTLAFLDDWTKSRGDGLQDAAGY